jgi:predicted O-methyltransferase YrrM
MSSRTISMTDALYDYLLSVSLREPPVLRALRKFTQRMPRANLQISPEQGQFMSLLVRLTGAMRAIEIGTFTGYSALCVALAMPDRGRMICCDVNEDTSAVALRFWRKAGVAHKIDLRVAPALETVNTLLAKGQAGKFDFAFIDADKPNYGAYYESALELLRPGGLVAIDNVLWGGDVLDADDQSVSTRAVRALNKKLKGDKRVDISLVPIGDGLTLARKR